jgi:hypothetical protein
MLAEFFPVVFLELLAFLVCAEATLWVLDGSPSVPTIDPYIPWAKRPPSYPKPFLHWLSVTIDQAADKLAPCVKLKSRPRNFSTSRPTPVTDVKGLFCPQRISDFVFWCLKYFFAKWNFTWWRFRCRSPSRTAAHLLALSALATGIARANAAAAISVDGPRRSIFDFDSDSFDILVDGRASACISNNLADFIKPLKTSAIRVKGFNGTTSSTKVGTVRWSILDDSSGQERTLEVRNTYYVPACPLRLLSPQHYSQQQNNHRGTYSVNFGDQVVFVWNNGRFKTTMLLTAVTNVGILRSAPGHSVFASFVEMDNQEYPTHFCSAVVTDDEADKFEADAGDEATLSSTAILEGDDEDADVNSGSTPSAPRATTEAEEQPEAERPSVIQFDLNYDDPSTNVPSQDDATSTLYSQAELLRWHYCLGHLSFVNICLMAARGEIPKRLAACRVPRCQLCLYGRATKKPWRTKAQPNKIKTVTKPGECISSDELESPVPGFKGQSKGFFFRERYKVATIFLDHFSGLSYVHLQDPPRERRRYLQAKRAFEAYTASFGVVIVNYHADNGRFAERLFLDHAALNGQGVSLCGVNAHF